MNSYPNSDYKQCTESKLGWVTMRTPKTQVARTLRAQCPGRGRCCAHNTLVARMSRAQPAQAARSACAGRAHSAQVAGACRDLPALPSQPPRSRRHFNVATSWRPSHVATYHWCRDTVSPAQHQARSHPMSRHQFHVATSWTTNLCRDIKFMSRPQFPAGQVATLVPCRDLLETI